MAGPSSSGHAGRTPARVVVLHVPKTAGSALRTALVEAVAGHGTVAPWEFTSTFFGWFTAIDALPATGRARVAHTPQQRRDLLAHRLAFGHYMLDDVRDHPGALVTVLREPRARLASLYSFWVSVPRIAHEQMGWYGNIASGAAARMTFSRFLDHRQTLHQVDNGMARQLLPAPLCSPDRPLDRTKRADYERALDRALTRFDLVGVQHDLPRFLRQLEALTGWVIGPLHRVNETPALTVGMSESPLSPDVADHLAERTWLDQWLFARVHERPELDGVHTDADELFRAAAARFEVLSTPQLRAS